MKILLLMLILMAPVCAIAQTPSVDPSQKVQGLYDNCKNSLGSDDRTFCYAYISGIGDQLSWMGESHAQHPDIAAICGHPSYGAMTQAFINFAEQNPKAWDWPRIVGVVAALQVNWP